MATLKPPGRRYKRYSPEEWEVQRLRIQELYIGRKMKLRDIVETLKRDYDFTVGERQLKRKLKEWDLCRNISSSDMHQIIQKRNELGRDTQFRLRLGNGHVELISQERLDRFQKRFRGHSMSPTWKTSDRLPSHILCYNPSSGDGDVISCPSNRKLSSSTELIFEPRICCPSAEANVFNEQYSTARLMFKRSEILFAWRFGRDHWMAVAAEFDAAIMKTVEYGGSPQNIIARISWELSYFTIRERQKYARASCGQRDLQNLRRILTALKRSSHLYSEVVAQQKALQIWEPILGPEHPKIRLMHENIALRIAGKETRVALPETSRPDSRPKLDHVVNMLHLDDDDPGELRRKFNALESSDALSRQVQRNIKLLQYGRRGCFLAAYYSFLGRHDDAEEIFRESNKYIENEVNMEMKLHRLLWYAEHKTRLKDWEGVKSILVRAHRLYMENETPSEFVVAHFPRRFKYLYDAILKRVAIDQIIGQQPEIETPCIMDSRSGTHSGPPQFEHELVPSTWDCFDSRVAAQDWYDVRSIAPNPQCATPLGAGLSETTIPTYYCMN